MNNKKPKRIKNRNPYKYLERLDMVYKKCDKDILDIDERIAQCKAQKEYNAISSISTKLQEKQIKKLEKKLKTIKDKRTNIKEEINEIIEYIKLIQGKKASIMKPFI